MGKRRWSHSCVSMSPASGRKKHFSIFYLFILYVFSLFYTYLQTTLGVLITTIDCFSVSKPINLATKLNFDAKITDNHFFYIKSWSPFIIVDNSVNLCLLNSTAEHTPSPTSQHFDYISPTLIPVSTILLWINPYSLMCLILKSWFLLCL